MLINIPHIKDIYLQMSEFLFITDFMEAAID